MRTLKGSGKKANTRGEEDNGVVTVTFEAY